METNQFRRYLLYAIGEVLLVMVGILLALYVNNKNEEEKQFQKSLEILQEIRENLEFNSLKFQEEIVMEQKVITSIGVVLNNLEIQRVYHDSLEEHLHLCLYWPTSGRKKSGYETLNSQGVELIRSGDLRKAIIDLNEISYAGLDEIIRTSEGYSISTLVPTFSELLYFIPPAIGQPLETYGAKPLNYKLLLESKKFKGMLSFWRVVRTAAIQLRMDAIEKNKILINMIDQELKNKN